jgi:ABC-type sugar transport system ATPase subunit
MATLELDTVRKAFHRIDVIHGIDLAIQSGEFIVFVGPSGCGKSTLLRLIAGLEPITGGEIRIQGRRVNEVPAAERGLAMVFQSYALYPHMSVRQNLSFGLENTRTPRDEIEQRVAAAAQMLRLDQLLGRRPGQLSGGQRQRVAIGRAVVREPKIFLFDEPLSNLDAELRVQMRVEISALHDRLGNTMIYVTHDQVEAMTLADRIAVLNAGRCEQFATPLELYNAPANLFVAGFIGSPRMNLLSAEAVDSNAVALRSGRPIAVPVAPAKLADAGKLTVGLRPEHLTLGAPGEGLADLVVDVVEQLGGESYVHGTLASGDKATARLPGQTRVVKGERVSLSLQPGAPAHLFDGAGLRLVPEGA